MKTAKTIAVLAIPGLMFCILPVRDMLFRVSWQVCAVTLAGIAFTALLTSWWRRLFFLCALAQALHFTDMLQGYLALTLIAVFMGAVEAYRRVHVETLLRAMRAGALLLCAWMALQFAGVFQTNMPEIQAGPFNINAASVFLALCLPAFYRGRWTLGRLGTGRWAVFAPVAGAGLMACRSTTGLVAAMAGLVFYTALGTRGLRRAGILAAACAAGMVLYWQLVDTNMYDNPRFRVWRHVALSYRSAPEGRGMGSFYQIFPLLVSNDPELCRVAVAGRNKEGETVYINKSRTWRHAHNEYLQTGFELGLHAAALELAFAAWVCASAWRRRRRLGREGRVAAAGMVTLITACAGWHVFHVAPLAVLGVAWIGAWEKVQEGFKDSRGQGAEGKTGSRKGAKALRVED